MADVVPHVVKADDVPWQMLSPYDMWQIINHKGRCCNHLLSNVADVNSIMLCVADGKPTKLHVTTFANLMADVIAKVVDGIATKGRT